MSGMCGHILTKLLKITQLAVGTDGIFEVMSQMSRSCSDDHGNLVNSIACEPLKGFEPILTHTYYTWGTN